MPTQTLPRSGSSRSFRFVHAADLHLDSPFKGLRRRSSSYASRLEAVSRQAFGRLLDLAIAQQARFMVISGDVFDGQWRDYRTGLFFTEGMRRLRQARVDVVLLAGNHDAENAFAQRLQLSDNVELLDSAAPQSVMFADVHAAVHGQSFAQREVLQNLAAQYPPPLPNLFNIGMLHTACSGREGHAPYAPCSVEQLRSHGYDYWALGHVHQREVLSTDPYIVYPGNLQGRSIRETGAKGATLVTVTDGKVAQVQHVALDGVRWALLELDAAPCQTPRDLQQALQRAAEAAVEQAEGRGLAVRLVVRGRSALHEGLCEDEATLRDEVETQLATVSCDLWLEKVELRTEPLQPAAQLDQSVAGQLRHSVQSFSQGDWAQEKLEQRLAELCAKVPQGAQRTELLGSLRKSALQRATQLALSLIETGH